MNGVYYLTTRAFVPDLFEKNTVLCKLTERMNPELAPCYFVTVCVNNTLLIIKKLHWETPKGILRFQLLNSNICLLSAFE